MSTNTMVRRDKSKEKPYTMIANTVIRDQTISFKARGLLTYLLSMPDDWTIYLTELESHSDHDGRDSIASAMDELRAQGYISLQEERNDMGRIVAWVYCVHEEPVEVDAEVLAKLDRKRKNKEAREQRKQAKKRLKQDIEEPETGFPLVDVPETGSPQVGNPEVVNPQLLITKSTNDLSKQMTDKQQQNAVVVLLGEIHSTLQVTATKKELTSWLDMYTTEYIRDKIRLVAEQRPTAPLRALRAAIRDDWASNMGALAQNASEVKFSGQKRAVPAAQPDKYRRFYEAYELT